MTKAISPKSTILMTYDMQAHLESLVQGVVVEACMATSSV